MKNNFAWVANDINNQSSSSRTFEFPVDIGNNTLIDKENIIALAKKPLQVIAFDKYIQFHSYAGSNDTLSKLPFKIDDHPYARSHIARQMINRLDEDVVVHSDNMKNAKFSAIRGLSKSEIKGTLDDAAKRKEVVALVQSLMKSLRKQKDIDESNIAKCLTSALGSLNNVVNCQMNNHVSERQKRSYQLGQHSGLFAKGTLDVLVQCLLSSDGEENIKLINPLLSDAEVKKILNATVGILTLGCRIAQISRSMLKVHDLIDLLEDFDKNSAITSQDIVLKSKDVCKELLSGRHFMKEDDGGKSLFSFDPRYLVFEFAHNILLRKAQVDLVNKFVDAMKNDSSMCHQMIMGAGKTTVVGPLLSLILA